LYISQKEANLIYLWLFLGYCTWNRASHPPLHCSWKGQRNEPPPDTPANCPHPERDGEMKFSRWCYSKDNTQGKS